ncbi:MAG: hypothetical protein KDD19_01945 [Phaeodactylibacter sp.]|nr:hypothetical protein [Phaeodactylibacter sp.]MCB9051925.1 hypothetical protein [Lewinellaceae bacterium]
MKQFFLLTVLFTLLTAAGVQAQHCPYSKTAEAKACPHPTTAAKAAAMDASIDKRFDEKTGQTTFVRREVCPTSGKVSYTAVEYCSRSGKFVNVSPREKQCVKSKAECTSKASRATKVSNSGKINCTPAQKAACAKACAGAKASSGAAAASAKLVKNR